MNNKPHSSETKMKISQSLIGRRHSQVTIEKYRITRCKNVFSIDFIKSRSLIDIKTNCWNWLGTPSEKYPTVSIKGVTTQLSRLICDHLKGGILTGQDAMHSCDNPRCVNPDHISVGSRSENITQCVSKGRMVGFKGKKHSEESKIKISNSVRSTKNSIEL